MNTIVVITVMVLGRAKFPRRRRRSMPATSPLRLALLIRIGLSAGMSLAGTLAMSADHVDPRTARLIHDVRRRGLIEGLTAAMAGVSDDQGRLFRLLADAHLSGAPMQFAVSTFISDETERMRAESLYRARSLPVRLTLPVALGLLPGFVLLVVAPQVVLAVRDLLGQVAGL